jgi:hypothetical protein
VWQARGASVPLPLPLPDGAVEETEQEDRLLLLPTPETTRRSVTT